MKTMPDAYYVHRSSVPYLPEALNWQAREAMRIAGDVSSNVCTLLKIYRKQNAVALLYSPDWDLALEPSLAASLLIKDGIRGAMHVYDAANPPVYHSKELFVEIDYPGFNVNEAVRRTASWKPLVTPYDRPRIGRRKYWNKFCERVGLAHDPRS